ncbi:LytTR family DNA-binding domain-containing protein [Pedobacter africanus]|uniref:HTH LytTR-type domain-containing protein n=1 Tax=Pedobacter africanus TaxID=151894 RepID=A0A1W2AZT1_9SPHI|nr:LytTR family DNA-binding domain-containing protein [Pedobacter africanus]SMC66219.1 hypothetical protein SAMN04488524_1800 [Pedobacter africanus]
MKNYLIIDHHAPASRALRLAIAETEGTLSINQTHEPAEVKELLASVQITAVFVRFELWDHRLFPEYGSIKDMPELVLLGSAEQEPVACCGLGLPHFFADSSSVQELQSILNVVNSAFINTMDFRFVLAKDGDKVCKVDLREIIAVEAVGDGTVLHTTCGKFSTAKTLDEMETLLPA